MYAALSIEASVLDPIGTPTSTRLAPRRGARILEFRAIWGHLFDIDDSTQTDPCPLDWSGTLHLEGGIMSC